MKLPIRYQRAAINEYLDAANWLDDQRPGFGAAFIQAVDATIDRIRTDPRRYPIEYEDIRLAPVPEYSYVIYYRIENDRIRVLSVFHTSRDPAVWQARL